MNEYREQEVVGCEDDLLSDVQRRSLQAMRAPAGLGERIQQRLAELHPVVRRVGLRQLTAAGLLGFLSFFGVQVLVTQFGPIPVSGSTSAVNASSSSQTADSATKHHLASLAFLSDSEYYLDTLQPLSSPEVVLAAYLHNHGAQQ